MKKGWTIQTVEEWEAKRPKLKLPKDIKDALKLLSKYKRGKIIWKKK